MTPEMIALVVGVALLVAFLFSRAIWSDITSARAETRQLKRAGFIPCPDESEYLKNRVALLRTHARIEIRQPYKCKTGSATIYHYAVRVGSMKDFVVAEEFLFPLKRQSRAPFALFVLPAKLGEGLTTKLLRTVLAKIDKVIPPDTEQIEVPLPLRSRILTAMGPAGASLYELLDDQLLSKLLHSATKGFVAVRAVDDYCTMEVISAYGRKALPDFDWPIAAAAVRELATR